MAVTEDQKQKVKELLSEGRKIEAIKWLRETFSIGLKEAKILAEHIEEEMHPSEFKSPSFTPNARRDKMGKRITAVFAIIGLIMMGFAIVDASIDSKLASTGIETKGKVIDNPAQPVIEYSVNDSIYYYYSTTSSSPPSYYIGEEVDLFINPDNPSHVLVNTFTDRWLLEAILGGMGLIFTLVGLSVNKLS
ncbi:DUF3592 domain-containing protein [Fulvivirga lutea]|uniref:DUF3592 domain-containing protein n=1 Tax=Fulvivirga lutea TaxID=2810512 RepID=A0A974WGR0_9BACT|nr:DUF3592 domain-containing protein [Fulvivirga lutea]QSE98234.1 DUF3592 domain-containing protein [Fulvivirga lutea]